MMVVFVDVIYQWNFRRIAVSSDHNIIYTIAPPSRLSSHGPDTMCDLCFPLFAKGRWPQKDKKNIRQNITIYIYILPRVCTIYFMVKSICHLYSSWYYVIIIISIYINMISCGFYIIGFNVPDCQSVLYIEYDKKITLNLEINKNKILPTKSPTIYFYKNNVCNIQ